MDSNELPLSQGCTCECVCACYLVYFCGALCQDGANSRGQAQLHQALQMSLGLRLHLVSRLFQGAAVYQGETPARAQTRAHAHTCQQWKCQQRCGEKGCIAWPVEPAMQTRAPQTERDTLILNRRQQVFPKWQFDLLICLYLSKNWRTKSSNSAEARHRSFSIWEGEVEMIGECVCVTGVCVVLCFCAVWTDFSPNN